MKIDQITVTIGRTINLGNFNSLKIEASASARIENDDKLDAVREALIEECKRSLNAERHSGMDKI